MALGRSEKSICSMAKKHGNAQNHDKEEQRKHCFCAGIMPTTQCSDELDATGGGHAVNPLADLVEDRKCLVDAWGRKRNESDCLESGRTQVTRWLHNREGSVCASAPAPDALHVGGQTAQDAEYSTEAYTGSNAAVRSAHRQDLGCRKLESMIRGVCLMTAGRCYTPLGRASHSQRKHRLRCSSTTHQGEVQACRRCEDSASVQTADQSGT